MSSTEQAGCGVQGVRVQGVGCRGAGCECWGMGCGYRMCGVDVVSTGYGVQVWGVVLGARAGQVWEGQVQDVDVGYECGVWMLVQGVGYSVGCRGSAGVKCGVQGGVQMRGVGIACGMQGVCAGCGVWVQDAGCW